MRKHAGATEDRLDIVIAEVLSDVTGVTGRAIIQAILRGTRAPEKLAKYRDKGCKASEAEVAQARTGTYREEHLFELKLAYEAWQFTLGQVETVDGQIALLVAATVGDRAVQQLAGAVQLRGQLQLGQLEQELRPLVARRQMVACEGVDVSAGHVRLLGGQPPRAAARGR